jgi:hypothetical protein
MVVTTQPLVWKMVDKKVKIYVHVNQWRVNQKIQDKLNEIKLNLYELQAAILEAIRN